MFRSIDISTSGLVAQRQRMNTISGNIANINTTRNAEGNLAPFQRRLVTFTADDSRGVSEKQGGVGVKYHVEVDKSSPPRRVHDPGHPDADEDGYVSYPNIDLVTEFVNAVEASRAYEANVSAFETSKSMAQRALRILG